FREVMSSIHPPGYNEDFQRPDSVGGSDKSLYVANSPDNNTTSNFTESSGGTNAGGGTTSSSGTTNNSASQQTNTAGPTGFIRNFFGF
ncbi:transglycosylase domain-containing protein, partial [Staphylococcus chromogenes]